MKPCHHCHAKFDETSSRWCDCLHPLRTLICSACGRCFCAAPVAYKRAFWSSAARSLKEAPERFVHCAPVPAHRLSDSRSPVVLIVDDDESIRSLLACRIRELGYRVATTGDPHQGLTMARSREVAAVLTDALMPHMDGRELCRRIKSEEGASKRVIVMTSLYRARRYADEAVLRYKADAFLTKPIDFSRLAGLLAEFAPLEPTAALAS